MRFLGSNQSNAALEYSIPHICSGRRVIKGMPEYITEEEIKHKLKENQIKAAQVTRIIRTTKTDEGDIRTVPMETGIVHLEKTIINKNIYQLYTIRYYRVNI